MVQRVLFLTNCVLRLVPQYRIQKVKSLEFRLPLPLHLLIDSTVYLSISNFYLVNQKFLTFSEVGILRNASNHHFANIMLRLQTTLSTIKLWKNGNLLCS